MFRLQMLAMKSAQRNMLLSINRWIKNKAGNHLLTKHHSRNQRLYQPMWNSMVFRFLVIRFHIFSHLLWIKFVTQFFFFVLTRNVFTHKDKESKWIFLCCKNIPLIEGGISLCIASKKRYINLHTGALYGFKDVDHCVFVFDLHVLHFLMLHMSIL